MNAAPMMRRPCRKARQVLVGDVKARTSQGSIVSMTSWVEGFQVGSSTNELEMILRSSVSSSAVAGPIS